MSKHTKGPWGKKPTRNEDELAVYAGYGADRGDWGGRPDGIYPEGSFSPREIARVSKFHGNSEEMHANARMMAASLELLASLKYCLEFLEANNDGEEDVVKRIKSAKAAIVKAEGGPS